MIYFIFGEDYYRAKRKLEEIIDTYKKVHKSGLNLIYLDAGEKNFKDFYNSVETNSMFAEKKLIILKNVFSNKNEPSFSGSSKFQEEFLENMKNLKKTENIIIVFEDKGVDPNNKLFKALRRSVKCQEFKYLSPIMLKKFILEELKKKNIKINSDALNTLILFVGNDLWRLDNEINKLLNYKNNSLIKKEDVELLVEPNIENDIFKTLEALASKNKKLAISLIYKHLESGDPVFKILSMISYQIRTLLIIKELKEKGELYEAIVKKSGLKPFVVRKNYFLCDQFSIEKLKKIYHKIFQLDLDIKTSKIEPEIGLEVLLSEI